MRRILAADYLIIDRMVELPDSRSGSELAQFVSGFRPGSKNPVSKAQFEQLLQLTKGMQARLVPGGSSANTLVTLAKLLPKQVAVDFIGMAGEGDAGALLSGSLVEAGVNLLPLTLALPQEAAVSHVFLYPENWPGAQAGERVIFTWPGNARERIKSEAVQEEWVEKAHAVLLQGALWKKFDPALPERLLALTEKHGKKLILTLPTQAGFGAEPGSRVHFRKLIGKAALVACNREELEAVWGADGGLAALTAALAPEAVALVTMGHEGMCVVQAGGAEPLSFPARHGGAVNTLGAGDTAFAGFIAGWLKGLSPADCGRIAAILAEQKLTVNGPRLPDPGAILKQSAPELAEKLS